MDTVWAAIYHNFQNGSTNWFTGVFLSDEGLKSAIREHFSEHVETLTTIKGKTPYLGDYDAERQTIAIYLDSEHGRETHGAYKVMHLEVKP
jgi:hypothetical protein